MFNSILVIIGTIIGAGFASGKEIFTFFNVYGVFGFLGLISSGLLIGFVIYKTFYIILTYNICSYSDFINVTITKSSFMNLVICNIINIFLLISFVVMVAGFSAFFSQELNLPYFFGSSLISVLCFFTFLRDIDGIVKINKYFIPFLILIILLLGFVNIKSFSYDIYHTASSSFNWFISSILYASYNLIIAIPILIGLKNIVRNISNAKMVAVLSSLFLFIIAVTLFCMLNYYFPEIENVELPTIYISSSLGQTFKYICGFVILGAIFTTAISSGYGFLSNLNLKDKKIFRIVCIMMCIASIFLSSLGFSNLLNYLYPILGILRFSTDRFYIIFYKKTLKKLFFIDISI